MSLKVSSEEPTLSVAATSLQAGHPYRLELPLPDQEKRPQTQGRPGRVRIEWDSGDQDGDSGDEYFPFQRRGKYWIAPLRYTKHGCHVEFRAPPQGKIRFTLMAKNGWSGDAARSSRLTLCGPGIPIEILRKINGIRTLEQERCELLDLSLPIRSTLPAQSRSGHARSLSGVSGAGPLQIAFLGSSELRDTLTPDCGLTPMLPDRWKYLLRPGRYDFLLLEPVLEAEGGAWRHAMARSGPRESILSLLNHCKEINLPVVLWLRTEPELYEEFSWLVPHCDRVYAIDRLIQRMIEVDHPGAAPQILSPFVQPQLHNPFRPPSSRALSTKLEANVLLDGWWRLATATRDRIIQTLQRDRLLVAESQWEFSFTRLATMPEWRWNTLGCLDAVEKAVLSRFIGAALFLPDETLPDWRRDEMMLQAAACGNVVLFRNEGLASPLLDEGLCLPGSDDGLLKALEDVVDAPLRRAQWRQTAQRTILERHTCKARLAQIASDLQICQDSGAPPRVACLLVSMRPWLLDRCIERFKRDEYPEKELIIVVHGSPATARELAARAQIEGQVQVFQASKARSLGACLNYAARQTDAPIWAKFDDDDLYGRRYLSDMMLYQQAMGSSLVAKPQAFIYLDGEDQLLWHPRRAQRSWTHHADDPIEVTAGVAGGTLLGKQSLLEQLPFSELRRGGSDSDLVLRARRAGHDLLVTDAFNFAFFRSGREGFHTWESDTERLKSHSTVVGGTSTLHSDVFI